MGLFDWLWKPNSTRYVKSIPDSIWLTKSAKFQGVARAALQNRKYDGVVLLAHFEETLGLLNTIADKLSSSTNIVAGLVSELDSESPLRRVLAAAESPLVLVAERHLLPTEDEQVIASLNERMRPAHLQFHVSLEDALMQAFAGAWVHGLLLSLGAKEEEAIQSEMVQRRIHQAQKKLAARCTSNEPACSGEEWLRLNDPKWTDPAK